jgi:hypothetical protein
MNRAGRQSCRYASIHEEDILIIFVAVWQTESTIPSYGEVSRVDARHRRERQRAKIGRIVLIKTIGENPERE